MRFFAEGIRSSTVPAPYKAFHSAQATAFPGFRQRIGWRLPRLRPRRQPHLGRVHPHGLQVRI